MEYDHLIWAIARYYNVKPERVYQAKERFAERLEKDLKKLRDYDITEELFEEEHLD